MTSMILLNQGDGNEYLIIAVIVILILFSPAIIMSIIGVVLRKKKPKTSKILFIIAGVYLLVGLGICGTTKLLA